MRKFDLGAVGPGDGWGQTSLSLVASMDSILNEVANLHPDGTNNKMQDALHSHVELSFRPSSG